MTDKQIIIDDQKKTIHRLQDECTEKTNAIIALGEQLKAKEQECEELKRQLETKGKILTLIDEAKNEYSKENKELKAENDELKDLNTRLDNQRETYWKGYQKLKQTLTEIKEIAEHCINQDICTFCDYSDRCHIEDEEIPTYDVCKLILQKISECEGNYDMKND